MPIYTLVVSYSFHVQWQRLMPFSTEYQINTLTSTPEHHHHHLRPETVEVLPLHDIKGQERRCLLLLYQLPFTVFLLNMNLKPLHCVSYTTRKGVVVKLTVLTLISPTTNWHFQVSGWGSFWIIYKPLKQALNVQNASNILKTGLIF